MKAAIFDMDGLMLDTERLYAEEWKRMGQECGFAITEDILNEVRGTGPANCEAVLRRHFGDRPFCASMRIDCTQRVRERTEREGVPVKEGLRELLAYLKEEGCRTAVATSTERTYATFLLENAGLTGSFDTLVFGDSVKRSKPEPDIFLYAAQCLGTQPEDCMVLEDSPNGIRAGSRAGMKVVMVPDLAAAPEEVKALLYAECSSLHAVLAMLREKGIPKI